MNYNINGIQICWTDHALKRVSQRFSGFGSIQIPNYEIAKRCKESESHEFRVGTRYAVFICRRAELHKAVVVTVLWNRPKHAKGKRWKSVLGKNRRIEE
jgi:hypothetical protein